MAFQWTALALLAMAASASAQAVMRMGTACPDPPVQQNFDIEKYTGRWFEYVKFPNFFQIGARCVIANYTLQEGGTVRVVNVAIEKYSLDHNDSPHCPLYRNRIAVGDAAAVDPSEPAKLEVRFSESGGPPGKYWVLETDYDNYAVVYSCSPYMSMVSVENAWVLTREKNKAPANLDQIYERLTQAGIDPTNFELSDQNGCPEWPTPE